MTEPIGVAPGWGPDEIAINEPTRNSRLRWVVVVDAALTPGEVTNAVACVAANAGQTVSGLVGPGGVCDMPASAQTNRVYAEYLDELARTTTEALQLRALSLFGPKNGISKLTGKLALLQ